MICKKCCKAKHHNCRNITKNRRTQRPTWCDCQCRIPSFPEAMQRLITLPLLTISQPTEWVQNTTTDSNLIMTRSMDGAIKTRYIL